MELLGPATGKIGFTVRNTWEFEELVRRQFLGENDVFVTFDAVSLFCKSPRNPRDGSG